MSLNIQVILRIFVFYFDKYILLETSLLIHIKPASGGHVNVTNLRAFQFHLFCKFKKKNVFVPCT